MACDVVMDGIGTFFMMDHQRPERQAAEDARAGLCGRCRHVQRLRSDRGTTFYRCLLATSDARFPRYPSLPMVECIGHEPDAGDEAKR